VGERAWNFALHNVWVYMVEANQLTIVIQFVFRYCALCRGQVISAGKYSLLLSATFQSPERTLRDDEVALWSKQIVKAIEALGGSLRT